MSIRDHLATLTFTVTMENLTLEDAGTYKCGVDIPLINGSWRMTDYSLWDINPSLGIDDSFKVMVSVVPSQLPGKSPNEHYSIMTAAKWQEFLGQESA